MIINSNYGIYSLYNSMYKGNIALYNNKFSRSLFPTNKTDEKDSLGADAVGFVKNIKSASKNLSGALKDLSGPAFTNKTATSSNTDVMTVSYSGNKPNSIDRMSVKVSQTAAGQMNEGSLMNAPAAYEGSKGTNQFTIEAGGKTTQLSVNITASDTNKDAQQKMADAINKAGAGVKATVETDSETNKSMLKLESLNTGSDPKNGFEIKDVTGNLAAQTGANEVSREGRDAIYSINGGAARTSQTNTVNLGNGVSATFKKASEQEVIVSPGKDTDYMKNAVNNMVKSYNDLYAEAAKRVNDPKSQNLATKMISTSKTYSGSLASIGIGFDKDGRMTVDTKKFDQAAENGKLEKFFTENSGKNYGYTNQLSRLSDNVSRNTANYVSSSQFGNSLGENFSYSNYGSLMQYNFLSAGSIFDYSF